MVPVDHDHVGHMVFTTDTALCRKCGAEWIATDRGWVCVEAGER